MAAVRVLEVAQVSAPPNSRADTRYASSAPMARHSRSMDSVGGGPMDTTHTFTSGLVSLIWRAASRAFISSGLEMVAMAARSMVPSALTATTPEVSGTCLTQTMIFMVFYLPAYFKMAPEMTILWTSLVPS